MYNEAIVHEKLKDAKAVFGYTPTYHSSDEIDKFNSHLSRWERYDAKGQLYFSRDLTKDEYHFIENERILCACDAVYALTRYFYVQDENDLPVRFKFRDTQKVYLHVVSQLEEQLKAIELIIAKGRQVFVTTITEMLIAHRLFFLKNINALTASADSTKSEEMGKKILFAYDNLPWWIRPKASRRVESVPGLLEFESLNSRVSIQHGATQAKMKGAQRVGLGRGGTRTCWHVSEVASIPNPQQQIEAALMRGTHASPRVFGVLESTFAGNVGWFPEKYLYAKEHRGESGVRLTPIFFNWPCAHDIYPTRHWIRSNPVPQDWKPTGKVLEKIMKAELFIRNDPLLSDYFGKRWEMPMDQQWYYHCGYTEADRTGSISSWTQEMAVDDMEAMVSSYDSVFGRETIEILHKEREQKYEVYMLTGQSIEDNRQPPANEIDYDKPRVLINHKSRQGVVYHWELVPLQYSLYTEATGIEHELELVDCRLFIYKIPPFRVPGAPIRHIPKYGIGVDTGGGMGYDSTVVSVTQAGFGSVPDVQVAEWRSNQVGHVEAFSFAMPIALYFANQHGVTVNNPLDYPMVGIEQLTAVGDVCQKEMKRLGYPAGRFFNFGRYDGKVGIKQPTTKQGWFTTGWSRPILIDTFVHCVRKGWYILNSPWTIEEARNFEIHFTAAGKEKKEHSERANDDGVFAAAISAFILHDMETLADRSKNQFRAPENKTSPIDLSSYVGESYSKDQRQLRHVLTLDDILREER